MSPHPRHLFRLPVKARRCGGSFRTAFTLIELLVVVGIIAVLAALLIPSLGRVKNNSRAAQTQAFMAQISSCIDTYYRTFGAYPGPIPTNPRNGSITVSTADTDNGTKYMSGAQNLLLGLSYAMMIPTPLTATAVPIPGASPATYADPSRVTGPTNYAAPQPNGSYEQLTPYFTPTPQQLSSPIQGAPNAWPAGGIANAFQGNFAFPVLVDTFPDALPILYYRRTPGVTSPVVANPGFAAAYYLDENREYTNATNLTTGDGTTSNQSAHPLTQAALQNLVQTADGSAARGGYLLMSAGVDRFYGSTNSIQADSLGVHTDNQVVVGGN